MARALYIHWPFCAKKCPYCDFNSHVRDAIDHDQWQGALIADMRFEAGLAAGEPLESIFFGGGTPSLMPPSLVSALLDEAERLWGFSNEIEITLEANPSSVEAANFADLASAGINRVSLGIQSLEDDTLQFLGRLHSASEGLRALDTAQEHFERVSFDLIYARPDQTAPQWHEELGRAIAFGTGHLSLYQLTIEPGTRFQSDVRLGKFAPLDDDPAAELYALTQELTGAAGLPAYETSNHAKPGEESQHNLTYWRYDDYCGVGPGAHGRRNGTATERHKKPENFLDQIHQAGHGVKTAQSLSAQEQVMEAVLMGLRLTEGIDLSKLSERFNIGPERIIDAGKLKLHAELGFAWQQDGRIGISHRGRPLLDALLGDLVSDAMVST